MLVICLQITFVQTIKKAKKEPQEYPCSNSDREETLLVRLRDCSKRQVEHNPNLQRSRNQTSVSVFKNDNYIVRIFLDPPSECYPGVRQQLVWKVDTLKYWCHWRILITNGRLSVILHFFKVLQILQHQLKVLKKLCNSGYSGKSLECVTRNVA